MSDTTTRTKECSVSGCSAKHLARGFCQNHYRVFKKRGTPMPEKPELKVHTATGGYQFKTSNGKTKYLHVAVMEEALGRPLAKGEEVHHKNRNPTDNDLSNLVLCANHEEHMVLHQRERASDACGNPDHRPCRICGEYDATGNMNPYRKQFYHRACLAEQSRKQRAKAKLPKEAS
jgi:hypothetical protein